ncbi:hypothetical protein [Streptomyces plumbiresistens]|uniref:Uncharacterized protein n=1 Tax=Streptomyces plumbiresistens TaxID=511811 RepID=A0ABP7S1B0_9ACTN
MSAPVRPPRTRRIRQFLAPLLPGRRAGRPQAPADPGPYDGPGTPDVWLAGLRLGG